MSNLFSKENNQRLVVSTLIRLRTEFVLWNTAHLVAGIPEIVEAISKGTPCCDRAMFDRIATEHAIWRIAEASSDIGAIANTLLRNDNCFFNQDGSAEIGQAEYICLHKTTDNQVTPYIHTVLLKTTVDFYRLYPLFVMNGKVCLGNKPVSVGSIGNFNEKDKSFLSSSTSDNFSEIRKLKG